MAFRLIISARFPTILSIAADSSADLQFSAQFVMDEKNERNMLIFSCSKHFQRNCWNKKRKNEGLQKKGRSMYADLLWMKSCFILDYIGTGVIITIGFVIQDKRQRARGKKSVSKPLEIEPSSGLILLSPLKAIVNKITRAVMFGAKPVRAHPVARGFPVFCHRIFNLNYCQCRNRYITRTILSHYTFFVSIIAKKNISNFFDTSIFGAR